MDTNKDQTSSEYDISKIVDEVQELLGDEDYTVITVPIVNPPRVGVYSLGAMMTYSLSDPTTIAKSASRFFERRKELLEENDNDDDRTVDENKDLAEVIDRLLVQNNFLIQRIDTLISECDDLDRLKAVNLDLKRKLRDARSEVTRYQMEYIDLLERRGQ